MQSTSVRPSVKAVVNSLKGLPKQDILWMGRWGSTQPDELREALLATVSSLSSPVALNGLSCWATKITNKETNFSACPILEFTWYSEKRQALRQTGSELSLLDENLQMWQRKFRGIWQVMRAVVLRVSIQGKKPVGTWPSKVSAGQWESLVCWVCLQGARLKLPLRVSTRRAAFPCISRVDSTVRCRPCRVGGWHPA